MSKIKIENLSVTYNDGGTRVPVLQDINLSVEEGEFVCVIGSSGCGKSTLLSALEGLNKNVSGSIYIDGRKISGPGVDRGVVFQHYSLFPWLTAKGNVIFAMRQAKIPGGKKEISKIAESYLDKVGLLYAKDRYPSQLSGGMQQRVAIARALAMNSAVLLMDEPFGAIDPKTRRSLQDLLSRLASEEKKTVIFVTHDIDEAIILADRVLFLGSGKISGEIPVKIAKPRVKEKLFRNPEYIRLSNSLMSLFYEKVVENIGDGEVFL